MELIKSNETFTLIDKTEQGWMLEGNVSKDSNGAISINASVNFTPEESVGNIHYHQTEEGYMNLTLEVSEINRDIFSAYADSIIDFVLNQFKILQSYV